MSTETRKCSYWLVSKGKAMRQEQEVFYDKPASLSLAKCVVVGIAGDSFSMRLDKDAYPDGAAIVVKGLQPKSWKHHFQVLPDYPWVFRDRNPELATKCVPYWDLSVPDWVFGEVDMVWVVVAGRTEFDTFGSNRTQMAFNIRAMPREWLAAAADEMLIERLNAISIKDTVAEQPAASAPSSSSSRLISPLPSPAASQQQLYGQSRPGVPFDPFAAARRGAKSRIAANSPSASTSGRGIKHDPDEIRLSRPGRIAIAIAIKREDTASKERRQSAHPLEQRQSISTQPRESAQSDRSSLSPVSGPAPTAVAAAVVERQTIRPSSANVVSDDSDDDVPLNQLAQNRRVAADDGRRRSPRLHKKTKALKEAEQRRQETNAAREREWTLDTTDLQKPVVDQAKIDLLQSIWHLPQGANPQLRFSITVYSALAEAQQPVTIQDGESDWEDMDGDEAMEYVPLVDIPLPFRQMMGDAAQGYYRKSLNNNVPPPLTPPRRGAGGPKTKKRKSKKVNPFFDPRSIRLVDLARQKRWERYTAYVESQELTAKAEQLEEARKQAHRFLPSRN